MSAYDHLPAGREPGGQSRRTRSRRRLLGPFVGIVGTAMFAAGVWVAAGGRGERFDRSEELFGGLFFGGMGLLCALVGFAMWEAARPQRYPRLRGASLAVVADDHRRGDEIAATLTRRRGEGQVEVGLVCVERFDTEVQVFHRGGATVARQTGEATVHEEWQPVPDGGLEHTAGFRVPVGAPYSYEGECLSYAWRVTAREVRELREDRRLDEPIWVAP